MALAILAVSAADAVAAIPAAVLVRLLVVIHQRWLLASLQQQRTLQVSRLRQRSRRFRLITNWTAPGSMTGPYFHEPF